MWVPPYFGSYEELVNALLHNPFLGSGGGGVRPHLAMLEALRTTHAEPQPNPWLPATCLLASAIGLKKIAGNFPAGQLRNQFEVAADQAISGLIDDYCGTPPRPHPWVYVVAAELTALANSLPEGGLRNDTLNAAGQLIQRAFGTSAAKVRATAG